MLITKKMLLTLTLVGALVGAGIGSLITHSAANSNAANRSYNSTQAAYPNDGTPGQIAAEKSSQFMTSQEQTAFRQGFEEGFSSCTSAAVDPGTRTNYPATYRTRTNRTTVRRTSNTRRAYYDYGNQPRGRTFWQKHRDKLTLAIGTGAGAAIGGLIGGKKGAGIGSLAGLGSSALYTYKLRKRTRSY